ncbi:O-antigen ligase family protein [Haliea sp. E17]|uniref:O-antigen ligase family protein n=1 Tax=Haliea sp. E17 TaxID=3401576 RepID=UPI003AB055D5
MKLRPESLLFAGYCALLVWAPLPFASYRPWAAALLTLLAGLLFAGWLLLYCAGGARVNPGVWRYARLPLALLLLVQAWVLLQTVPLPRALVQWLSPQAYAWHIREGWLTLSLDPSATRAYLLRGLTFTVCFFLTLALVNSRERLKLLLQVLVFSGTFQAAYGTLMVLSGLELGFFVEKYTGKGVATGTFVNRNHLAGYLVMCLAAGIGLLLSQLATTAAQGWRERLQRWLALLLSAKIRLRIYLAVMVIGLVLTRARMGNVAFFTALGVAGAVALYAGGRFSWRVVAFLGSLLLVDLLILGQWFGLDRLVERLEQTSPDSEARVFSSAYTFDYIQAFPLTGSGGGSFYGIFPNFQHPSLEGFYVHAHNDYLEFAAELGVPATLVLALVVLLALHSAWRVQCRSGAPLERGAAFAVTMTVCWAALHSLSDFNLQIPANALTFVSILATAFACRALPGRDCAPGR